MVTSAREHIYDLRTLENFTYIDELGKDQGVNIRHRSKATVEFLQDDIRLREERKKAKKTKDKYVGVSRNMATTSSSRYADDYEEEYSPSTSGNVFKDEREEREPDSPEPVLGKTASSPVKAQQSSSPDVLSTKSKSTKNYASKKIDLGAAADYAKQHQSEQTPKQTSDQETAQSGILFDLDSTDQSVPLPTAGQPASQVPDLLGSLTAAGTQIASPATENFADFSKVFDDGQQLAAEEIRSTATNKDDDEFDDFHFSPLPAQPMTTPTTTIDQPKSTTQDDLLGLDLTPSAGSASNILTGPQSLPLQMNVQTPAAGPSSSSSFFPASKSGAAFSADSILTPMTPSKSGALKIQSAEKLKDKETPKQSPTASAILSKKNTWGGLTENLKIDLDNLLQNKKEKPKPSMNQMAATRTGSNISQTSAQGDF